MTRPTGRTPPRILAQAAGRLLAREQGTIRKSWEHKTAVALVYPNSYYVGMSNLGFQSVYRLLNGLPEAVCERAFLPERDDQHELRRSRHPLFSLESCRPLRDFDIIAFSLSFENDYPAVLTLLELAGIPLLRSRRNGGFPLIMAGGVCAFLNPEPLAEFIDLFIIGEGEEVLPRLITAFHRHREGGCSPASPAGATADRSAGASPAAIISAAPVMVTVRNPLSLSHRIWRANWLGVTRVPPHSYLGSTLW